MFESAGRFRYGQFFHMAELLSTAIDDSAENILEEQRRLKQEVREFDLDDHKAPMSVSDVIDELAEFDYRSLTERHVFTIWNSVFLATYSQFERDMHLVCLCSKHALALPQAVTDFRGHGLPRSIKYLREEGGLTTDADEPWLSLTNFNQLRNLLAHNAGQSNRKSAHLDSFIRKRGGDGVERMSIRLTRGFVDNATREFRDIHSGICLALIHAIDKKM